LTCHVAIAAEESSAGPQWLQDANGCKFVNPSDAKSATITWTGQCVDGFVSGPGEVQVGQWLKFRGEFAEGRIVKGTLDYIGRGSAEGSFVDNRLHGDVMVRALDGTTIRLQYDHGTIKGEQAEITWPSGARYRGQIDPRTRLSQGKGTLEYPDGSAYEGEFKQGHLTGTGVMKYANGEVRSGAFLDGALNGQGSIVNPLVRYEGELIVGEPHGYGRVERANGDSYEGTFVAGKPQGKGKLKEADGSTYEGEFLAGEFHGVGTQTWSDGNRYVGQFVSGKRHGSGKLTEPSGVWEEGEWKDGLLSGKCHIVDHENVYDGQCLEGKRSGRGRTEDKGRQLVYEGEYRKDLYEGKGSLRVADLVYEGMFKGGMMEGPGTLSVGKLTMRGDFKSGVLARGTIVGADGRTFEVDMEKNEILEVSKDGSKHPVDELPPDITI
jgi:hypothetical protein